MDMVKIKTRKNNSLKVVFLDRDGVINEFPGHGNYVTRVKDFRFVPGALKALRYLTEGGYVIFVVSNQAGVMKGIYSKNKLNRITRHMLKTATRHKGRIKRVFYCIHPSDHGCGCRKPEIGLIKKALGSIHKTLRRAPQTFFVGDTDSDIMAGHNAGCKTIFVLSGRETRTSVSRWRIQPDFIAKDLLEASRIIVSSRD